MDPMLAVLELIDYAILAALIVALAGSKGCSAETAALRARLETLERKLDALMAAHGVELPPPPPSTLSPEVRLLASDPKSKIAAIKLLREQNPGMGLAEAKAIIEAHIDPKP